jgi:D-alanyl-D-alanine carboxypeptidase
MNLFFISLLLILNLFWLHDEKKNIGQISQDKVLNQIINFKNTLPPISLSQISPNISAQNYILIDVDTNKILLSKNIDNLIYPASTTKLITALTALNIYPLDEVITVKEKYEIGKVMDLEVGEKISIRSLVEALLVHSANDAAYNLAYHHNQGISGFIKQMNSLISKNNITKSHFTNYDGIHQPNHYSTVYDLSQIARLAIKNKIVTDISQKKEITVFDVSGSKSHMLNSTNELLDVLPEVKGLKTGWTPEAGGCFISLLDFNNRQFISVVARSEDRFADTKKIINWLKTNVIW